MDRPPAPGASGSAPRDDDRRERASSAEVDRSPGALTDAARAQETRRRLREQGIIPIEPDETVDGLLDGAERVLAVRHRAILDRRQPITSDSRGLDGDLYVTTTRVIHVGREPIVFELDRIADAVVVGERLILATTDGHALTLDVEDPRALRVEIAAARVAMRAATGKAVPVAQTIAVDSPSDRSSSG